MIKKTEEKRTAIRLRKQGQTYSQILESVKVAKSTLALWLHDVSLAKRQIQILSEKKLSAARRGGVAKKNIRIRFQDNVFSETSSEIGAISDRELFLIGVVLYWAEGSKEKEYRPGSRIGFSNMDPNMVKVFITWLLKVAKVRKNMITFEIYLHESHRSRVLDVVRYWHKVTGFSEKDLQTVYFKKNKLSATNRKNVGENYYGLIRINVRQSSTLVRKITGWTQGIVGGISQ